MVHNHKKYQDNIVHPRIRARLCNLEVRWPTRELKPEMGEFKFIHLGGGLRDAEMSYPCPNSNPFRKE